MKVQTGSKIPGTVLERSTMGGASGGEFLDKIFYISDGIMLSQVREISGVDGTTLQNWVKRGWVLNPKNKMYTKDMLARILIINMMRDTMQLSRISFLLKYINGRVDDREDDIIPESRLYDYICRVLDIISESGTGGMEHLSEIISGAASDYVERFTGARSRLEKALEIIILTCWANLIKARADSMIELIENR